MRLLAPHVICTERAGSILANLKLYCADFYSLLTGSAKAAFHFPTRLKLSCLLQHACVKVSAPERCQENSVSNQRINFYTKFGGNIPSFLCSSNCIWGLLRASVPAAL